MDRIRVLVVDAQSLFREGVCALLRGCEEIEVVGEAANGKETIEMVREQVPEVVLMDIVMPIMDGVEVIHCLRKENSKIKVLFLTQHEDRDRILTGLKAGAKGYLLKRATASDLVSAILAVYRGDYFLYPSVAKTVIDDYFQRRQPGKPDNYERLTHREREILKLVAEGHKSSEIAELFGIAIKAVLGHRASIMRKLSIHNRTELIKYAIRKHLVTLET